MSAAETEFLDQIGLVMVSLGRGRDPSVGCTPALLICVPQNRPLTVLVAALGLSNALVSHCVLPTPGGKNRAQSPER